MEPVQAAGACGGGFQTHNLKIKKAGRIKRHLRK
jgi:hypothetical protein